MYKYGTINHVRNHMDLAEYANNKKNELGELRVALNSCEDCPDSKTKRDLLAFIKAKIKVLESEEE